MIDAIKRKLGIETEDERLKRSAFLKELDERNARFEEWSRQKQARDAARVDLWQNSQDPKIWILLRMADVPAEDVFWEGEGERPVYRRFWEGTSKTKLGIYTARDGSTFEVTQAILDKHSWTTNKVGFADVATQSSGFMSGLTLTYVTTVPQVTTAQTGIPLIESAGEDQAGRRGK